MRLDLGRWLDFVWRLLAILLALFIGACSGGEADTSAGRTSCEEGCWQQELLPCRDNCAPDCASEPEGDARNRCIDACQGDCMGDYEVCVADVCG